MTPDEALLPHHTFCAFRELDCVALHLTNTSHSLEHDEIQGEEQTLRRRLWKNYAVKFPERAERVMR